jgi:hypothetical protein
MKKVFLAVMFAGMTAVCVQAQTYFAGGSLGFDYSDSESSWGGTIDKGPSETTVNISPILGYYLTEKVGAGVLIKLEINSWNNRLDSETSKENSLLWGFGPFLRYTLLTRGDFSILAQGGVGIFGSSSKRISGTTTNKGPSVFGFGIDAMPILSYKLSDKVNLELSSNLARFGFNTQTEKRGSGESESRDTENSFGFGVDATNFVSSPFQIGVIFKF